MRVSSSITFTLLVACFATLTNAQSWFIESDYSGTKCKTQSGLSIINVLPREQHTSCIAGATGSTYLACDASFSSANTYEAFTFSDSSCTTQTNEAPVAAGYCLAGASTSTSISCKPQAQRQVPAAQLPSSSTLLAGTAYFTGSSCPTSGFYHVELAPVTSCPKHIPDSDSKKPNKCYAMSNNRGQIYLCGTADEVLRAIDFTTDAPASAPATSGTRTTRKARRMDITARQVADDSTTAAPITTAAPAAPTDADSTAADAPTSTTAAPAPASQSVPKQDTNTRDGSNGHNSVPKQNTNTRTSAAPALTVSYAILIVAAAALYLM